MKNEITNTTPSETDLVEMGRIFAASGMFPEHRDAAQCATKLIVGRGMGLNPYDAMSLHIIQGKVVLGANHMAAAIKRSGKYTYRADSNDEACSITFFEIMPNGDREEIGTTTFTLDDAKNAGLGGTNWKKYPKAMLFARAISQGYRTHAPDALGCAPVYVEMHGESEIPRPEKTDHEKIEDLARSEILVRLAGREDGEEIKKKAIEKAGVNSIDQLNPDQTRRMIEWLRTK